MPLGCPGFTISRPGRLPLPQIFAQEAQARNLPLGAELKHRSSLHASGVHCKDCRGFDLDALENMRKAVKATRAYALQNGFRGIPPQFQRLLRKSGRLLERGNQLSSERICGAPRFGGYPVLLGKEKQTLNMLIHIC